MEYKCAIFSDNDYALDLRSEMALHDFRDGPLQISDDAYLEEFSQFLQPRVAEVQSLEQGSASLEHGYVSTEFTLTLSQKYPH